MCGAPLTAVGAARELLGTANGFRSDSPGPSLDEVNLGAGTGESVKISFRGGGEKTFHERLGGAMIQRKWLLYGAPPIPKPHQSLTSENADDLEGFLGSSKGFSRTPSGRAKNFGVAGLENRGLELQKSTEVVIGNAFEDLEALKTSAKEIIQLAERFAGHIGNTSLGNSAEIGLLLSQSANAVGLVTTKDMLGSGSNSESLYLSELSRNLAEFLTDDVRDLLRTEGGMMSLVDLWAVFNRARGGVELVNPLDIEKAVMLWEKLKLPVRFRKFKSGLRAVQSNTWSDDKIVATLLSWLQDRHVEHPSAEVRWDWRQFGRGVTAQEAADRFHWSVAVATEELETAEERGLLCRDEGMEGVRFWENMFLEFSKRA
ncbi:MAG: hypothetical protein M1824_003256 [Vezdaea acicularis]|nr:MAG: hypothetical protein M1824_003256 [Vezdaea acicularis]